MEEIIFKQGRDIFIWKDNKADFPEFFIPMLNRILNGNGKPPMGINKECNLSHMSPGIKSPEEFATLVFWGTHGLASLKEAPEEFIEWYMKNKKPYEPIDWLHSCAAIDD